jgi:hypothetical protein
MLTSAWYSRSGIPAAGAQANNKNTSALHNEKMLFFIAVTF